MAGFVANFNGEWVPQADVKVSPDDRGLMGDTVFDIERTFDGKIFRLKDHIERLYRSLQYSRMDVGMTEEKMTEICEEVVRRNEHLRRPGSDFLVRQLITRGAGMEGDPTVIISIIEAGPGAVDYHIDFGAWARFYETGAKVVIPSVRSYSSDSLDPKVKHFSRLNFALAQLQANDVDPEAFPVLLDQDGNISENIAANFFIVTNGVIRTPRDSSILQGISRKVVLELAEQMEIPLVEEELQPYDVYTADEAFLTNSGYQLLPVATIDKRPVRDGAPGPVSTKLLAAWSELASIDFVDQALQQANR